MVTHVALNKVTADRGDFAVARNKNANASGEPPPAAGAEPGAGKQDAPDSVPQIDPKALHKAVNDLARDVQNLQRSLEFSIDEDSGHTVVTVIDKETKQVIRTIPQKDILALASRLEKAAGLFVSTEA